MWIYLDDEFMILAEVGELSSSQWMPMAAALISLLLLIILRGRLMNQHINIFLLDMGVGALMAFPLGFFFSFKILQH